MGLNYEETKRIVDTAQSLGVSVSTFFNRRWDSDALTVKKVLESGELGQIHRMDSRFERFRPEVNVQSWQRKYESAGWWGTAS